MDKKIVITIIAIVLLAVTVDFLTVSAASAYRSSSSTTYGLRTNTTITAPSGIQNGDVLVILFDIGLAVSAPTPTPPAGFSTISGSLPISNTAGGFDVDLYGWYKIASSESGNYTVTHTLASSQGYMVAISGADTSNPINPAITTNTGTGVTSTALGLTTNRNDSLVMYVGSDWGDTANALTPPTGTTPTFTERLDPGTVSGIMYVADGVLSTAGATGNKTQTNNSSSGNPWMTLLVAINSASTAVAPVQSELFF